MRGNQSNRKRPLWGALGIIMLAVWLSGCSMLEEWNSSGLGAAGIADAATPTDTADPSETATAPPIPTVVPKPTETPKPTVTPKPTKPEVTTPSPNPTDPKQQTEVKLVSLTFDDGPDGKYTSQILDILKEYNVKATFFVVGPQVEKYPDIAKRIVDEGHSIGNHTWSHSNLTKLSDKARIKEIARAQQAILDATGVTSQLMRAPYGATSASVLKTIHNDNMKHVFWTVDTKDWAGTSVKEMYTNVMSNTHQGGIILMHSFGGRKHAIEHTVELLPSIIKDLRKKGFEFATVDELIASGQYQASVIK